MEEYNVRIFRSAQNDLRDIAEHLNTLTPDEATQYYELFMEKAEALTNEPEKCSMARDAQLRLRGYRVLSVGKLVMFYVINGRTVQLRRILYAKRQYERLV